MAVQDRLTRSLEVIEATRDLARLLLDLLGRDDWPRLEGHIRTCLARAGLEDAFVNFVAGITSDTLKKKGIAP